MEIDDSVGTKVYHNDHLVVVVEIDYDQDAGNPLKDCDGMGHIVSRNSRHINHVDETELEELRDTHPHTAVWLDYFEHGRSKWDVSGSMNSMPDAQWDLSSCAGLWYPDESCQEHVEYAAIKSLLPDGCQVNYESSGGKTNEIVLTMPNGSKFKSYKSFSSAVRAAAKRLNIPITMDALHKAMKLEAIKCAEQACETYTAWCNGDCYGFTAKIYAPKQDEDGELMLDASDYEDEDVIDEDSCWGFIGDDLKYMVDEHVKPFVERALFEAEPTFDVADKLAEAVS